MPFVRPVDSSATSYGKSNPYSGNNSNRNPSLSNNPGFRPEKQIYNYGHQSYCIDVNGQQFSSSDAIPTRQLEFLRHSQGGIQGSEYQPQVSYQSICDSTSSSINAQNPYASCFSTSRDSHSSFSSISNQPSCSMSDSQIPDNESCYDGQDLKFKLQELERDLLNDCDEGLFNDIDEMGIDDDWIAPMKSLLFPNSPKESSSNSNLSSTSSMKETKTPKQMLLDCAAAISEGNCEEVPGIIAELRQMVSIQGDPPQRIAACLVEGLAARIASSGQGIYKALRCKEPPTPDRLSMMQILFEACPYFKFGIIAANGAIIDAVKDEKKVHIIDFDINQGSQYLSLMKELAKGVNKPMLRITGVDDPESVQRSVGGLKIIGQLLEKLAEELCIPFEFRAIASKTNDVSPTMLSCRPDEALIVNFAYQLHHMPDESVSVVNQRDQLLRMVKGLGPKLVTLVEQDVNTNTAPFFPRFVEVYNYYNAVFESLDATLSRNSPDRMNVERQCLARDIVNIVACEGSDRIERYEAAGKWRMRMMMAGFNSCPLSSYVNEYIKGKIRLYCDRYKVKEESGAFYFGWRDKILVVASAWK